jgi:hypothetical protein
MSKSNSCFANIIAHAARTVSTPTGLDGGLQLMAYTGPVAAQIVLKLAQARAKHPILQKVGGDTARLTELAAGLVRGAGNVSEARVIMRAFGESPSSGLVGGREKWAGRLRWRAR